MTLYLTWIKFNKPGLLFGTDKYLIGCICGSNDFVDTNDFDQVIKVAKESVNKKG